ncbi:MAG: alpha/beta fold hydrolase [Bacteroidota bacterium]
MLVRLIRWFLGILLSLYVLINGMVYVFQQYFIFQPDRLEATYSFDFEAPFEEYFLDTGDGERINALLFKTRLPKKGILLYFHGNSDNLQRWGQYQSDFSQRGYDVFMIDYRAYGKSTGQLGETKMYQDALLVYEWARSTHEPEEIVIYGRSLGTAVASNLASRVAARMLVLETPFDNMHQLLKTRFPFLLLPEVRYRFPNDRHLAEVHMPVYIFQGTQDRIVPYQVAERLKPILKSEDRFITISGGAHRNLSQFQDYQQHLDRVLGIDEF